jgi:hypothetical protein
LEPNIFGIPGKNRPAGAAIDPEQGTAPNRRGGEKFDVDHLLKPLRPTVEIVAKAKDINPGGSNLNCLFDTGHSYLLMLSVREYLHLFYYILRSSANGCCDDPRLFDLL